MATPKEKKAPQKPEKKEDNINVELKKELQKRDTDTAPDEFIGPDADTDVPLDYSVENDAVLRGEPHTDDTANQEPDQKEEEKQ